MTDLQRMLVVLVEHSGLPQNRLAAAAGISEKHLSEMMNGHTEASLTVWQRILDAAGVTLPEVWL